MKPVRTTIIFGLICALLAALCMHFQVFYWGWPLTQNVFLTVILLVYSLLLCRWSNNQFTAIIFPLLLMASLSFIPYLYTGFILPALLLLGWIRSGICFHQKPLRGIVAEAVTLLGGLGIIHFWWFSSSLVFPLTIWLFFLVQSIYFYIVPLPRKTASPNSSPDPFEQASRELKQLLEQP